MSWRKDERLSGLNMHTLGMFVEVIHRWFGWTHSVAGDTQIFVPERTTPEGERRPVTIPDQILFNAVMRAGFPAQYVISAAVHHGTDRIEVYGEKGTLVYDVSEDILYAAGRDEALTPIPQRDDEWYDVQQWRVEQDFIDAIREGKPYHPDFEDGLRYMQVVEGVYTAAAKQQTVVLEG